MKRWDASEGVCDRKADVTKMSAVVVVHRRSGPGRTQKIEHYRKRDEAHFRHGKDTKDVKI